MKKLVASVCTAAALCLPVASAAPAAASETGLPAGTRPCGPMQMGFVVWVYDPFTGTNQDMVAWCVPIGP